VGVTLLIGRNSDNKAGKLFYAEHPKELREVQEIAAQNQQRFVEAWNDYFGIG